MERRGERLWTRRIASNYQQRRLGKEQFQSSEMSIVFGRPPAELSMHVVGPITGFHASQRDPRDYRTRRRVRRH